MSTRSFLLEADSRLRGRVLRCLDPYLDLVERHERLEELDRFVAEVRAAVADERAMAIAREVDRTSSRQVAALLGLSVASVSKAVARALLAAAR